VFFVHNRVQSISQIAQRLQNLVPEAEFVIAHGQMPEDELELAMLEFTEGRINVLICTTIIESGLDIPNVNTLIINDAAKLGLAQLYQLRGRIGRGSNRAYAYFLYNKGKRLTPAAEKRLQTIFEATELGAGFRIAMKDLEIRGAGNLLGSEQSGYIAAVGFELYCQLLTEAVEDLRGERAGEEKIISTISTSRMPQTTIDLPLSAYIPDNYVTELGTRLALYQKLSRIRTLEEVNQIAEELVDRFGNTPSPVKNLLYIVHLKVLGSNAGLQSISRENGLIIIRSEKEITIDSIELKKLQWHGISIGKKQIQLEFELLHNQWQEILETIVKAINKLA
jgi:transcription-repair coupling factor (superfamily II helicase)